MAGGLFHSRVMKQVNEHKKDTGKAAIQLNAYMSYLRDDNSNGSKPNSPTYTMKRPNVNNQVTEENEEDNDLDNTKRGLLSGAQHQSDGIVLQEKGQGGHVNKVHFAPPSSTSDGNELGSPNRLVSPNSMGYGDG